LIDVADNDEVWRRLNLLHKASTRKNNTPDIIGSSRQLYDISAVCIRKIDGLPIIEESEGRREV
jgi:hypothetical protein